MRKNFTTGFRDQNLVLQNINPIFFNTAGFNVKDHAGFKDGIIIQVDVRRFGGMQPAAMAKTPGRPGSHIQIQLFGGVHLGLEQIGNRDTWPGGFHTRLKDFMNFTPFFELG